MSKAHLLELIKEPFWRRAEVLPATLAALPTWHALVVRLMANADPRRQSRDRTTA